MPIVVTAEDITSSITKTNAAAAGVAAVFSNCPKLDAGTQAEWTAWYAGWQKWAAANSNLPYLTLGLPAIGNQAVSYESDVASWQTIANNVCGAQGPVLIPQAVVADTNIGDWSWVKWAVIGGIAVVVLPPVMEAVSIGVEALKAKKKKP
jgi:hypothetical protein